MSISRGVSKQLAYKLETTWGTLAGAAGGKLLRRVTADFNLTKETYASNEITPSFQTIDVRHGVRSAEGSLNAELSPGTYADFMASVLARAWTVGGTAAALTVTIAASGSFFTVTRSAASGSFFTVTRSAGSWLTDGFNVGAIMALTGAGLNIANQSNNLLIVGLTATVATVRVLSATTLVTEFQKVDKASIASAKVMAQRDEILSRIAKNQLDHQ